MRGGPIHLVQCKFDLSVYRIHSKRIIGWKDGALILEGAPGEDVQAYGGSWKTTHYDITYWWFDRWFSVYEFYDSRGQFEFFYVNIQQPSKLEGDTIQLVDLDLDLLVKHDLSWELLDEDEFQLHRLEYSYPPELLTQVRLTIDDVQTRIKGLDFPFRRQIGSFSEERQKILGLVEC
jgi:protein associated with RNAse G/E